jgi:hypothetical protein
MREDTPEARQVVRNRLDLLYRAKEAIGAGQPIGEQDEKNIRAMAEEQKEVINELWGEKEGKEYVMPTSIEANVRMLIRAYEILVEDLPIH